MFYLAALVCFLLAAALFISGVVDIPDESDGPDILAEKLELDSAARAALEMKDLDAYEGVQNRRRVLNDCIQRVHPPEVNDDTCRWLPGGKERYRYAK